MNKKTGVSETFGGRTYCNGRRFARSNSLVQSSTSQHRLGHLRSALIVAGTIQKGPRSGVAFSIPKPIVEMKRTKSHTPAAKNQRPRPPVLCSAAQALHFRPPASRQKVWTEMTNDQSAEETSPELIKNPSRVQTGPARTASLISPSATVINPRP
jgi:hypothetical protein